MTRYRSVAAKVARYVAARPELRPSLILLFLLSAITFPVLFLGFTTNAVTLLTPYGYHGPYPSAGYTRDPFGSLAGDMADEIYTRDALKDGQLPFWNPYQGNGWPFISDPSSKVFYPLNLSRLFVPVEYWDLIGISHVFLMGFFVFLFATACGLPRAAAVLSGASAFSIGHFQINIAATSIIQTEAWIPLVFYAVETAVGRHRRPYNWLVAAVATYGVATGGHPGPAVYAAVALAIYALIRLCQRDANWRGVLALAPAVAAGVLLAAPTWLNFLDFIRNDIVLATSAYQAIPSLLDLPALLIPYLFGSINTPLPSSALCWGIGYIPPAVTFLAVAATLKIPNGTRYPQLIALAATSVILLAWGLDAPVLSFLKQVPFLGRLNANYVWVVPSFAVCLAAGVGASKLASVDGVNWPRLFLLWASFVMVVLLVFAYAILGPSSGLASALSSSVLVRGLFASLGWMAVTPLVLYAVGRLVTPASIPAATMAVALTAVTLSAVAYFPSGSPRGAVLLGWLAIGALVVVSALIVFAQRSGWAITSWVAAAASAIPAAVIASVVAISYPGLPYRYDPFTAPPFVGWLKEHTKEDGARVYGIGGPLFPNFASAYRISSVNMLATSTPDWNYAFVQTYLDPSQSPSFFFGYIFGEEEPWEEMLKRRRYWSYMGVKYVVGRYLPFLSHKFPIDSNHAASDLVFTPFALKTPIQFSAQCPQSTPINLNFRIFTFARSNPGKLKVKYADSSGNVEVTESETGDLVDAAPFSTPNAGAVCRKPTDRLAVTVTFEPATASSMIAYWNDVRYDIPKIALMGKRDDTLRLVNVDKESATEIWQNDQAEPRLYVASAWQEAEDWRSAQQAFTQQADLRRVAFVEKNAHSNCPSDPTATISAGVSKVTVDPNTISATVETDRGGVLTLVDMWLPGWTAMVNGAEQKAFRVNGVFRGVCLAGPGRYDVTFRYEPPVFRLSLLLSGLGALVLLVVGWWQLRRRPL